MLDAGAQQGGSCVCGVGASVRGRAKDTRATFPINSKLYNNFCFPPDIWAKLAVGQIAFDDSRNISILNKWDSTVGSCLIVNAHSYYENDSVVFSGRQFILC